MNICYSANTLVKVIARIDFFPPFQRFNEEVYSDLIFEIKQYFPLMEPQKNIATEMQLSPSGINAIEREKQQLTFFSIDRKQRLIINENCLVLDFDRYDGYRYLENSLVNIVSRLFEKYPEGLNIKRLGLRYVNNLRLPDNDLFAWEDYINNEMIHMFNVIPEKNKYVRVINVTELLYDDFQIRFQYGMHNPDYPATIQKKIFVLDFDASYNGILNIEDIKSLLPKFHTQIQTLFEESITDKYRDFMNK